MVAPILSYEGLGLIQGEGWLFRGLDVHIGGRDRLALIGRNGVGKTTLLKCLADLIETDEGRRILVAGTNVVLLEQDPELGGFETLADWVLSGADAPSRHDAEAIADQLGVDLSRPVLTASGGERRRAAIARALGQKPDLLLLDEPTNHLDLAGIEWLEGWLGRFTGAFIAISHDRTFLARLTKSCLWLDRGQPQRAAMLGAAGTAKLALSKDDVRSKTVIDAQHALKSYAERPIIRDFSLRVQRGDRIGIVGANGAGKTTLLKLLTGALKPDSGSVTLSKTLSGIVIDQQRKLMDPRKTVRDVLAHGGDWIDVRGHKKHIKGYLKEFLFDPALAEAQIASLSGGERSRLLMAREFARKANLLVLDEPTNDLDLETLDLLQEVIADYEGTVLIVSHDRDFLDRTVTVTIGLDGSGRVDIVAGGYEDWAKRRSPRPTPRSPAKAASETGSRVASGNRKLTYKDQRDLDRLPTEIERL